MPQHQPVITEAQQILGERIGDHRRANAGDIEGRDVQWFGRDAMAALSSCPSS
jgi:hypothetical protein